jgi:hypothetical protein
MALRADSPRSCKKVENDRMGTRRQILVLLSLLAMAGPACAQFVLFPSDVGVRNRPIIADVTVTVTSETPWGPYAQTQSGKYWRSRDGKTRRDDGFGNSHIADFRSRIDIDHEAKVAYEIDHILSSPVDTLPGTGFMSGGLLIPFYDPAGLSPQLLQMPRKLVKIGKKQIDGRKVTGRRSEGVAKGYQWGPGGARWTYEVWTANDIKLAILFQYNTRLMQVVQRFENIQVRDPDPEVFRIPKGYQVRSNPAFNSNKGSIFSNVRIQK